MKCRWVAVAVVLAVTTGCPDQQLTVQDADKDGHTALTDCNDQDPEIHPNAEEICDGVDNNCDLEVDEGVSTAMYQDEDGDGYGLASGEIMACEGKEGYSLDNTDCDDSAATTYPGAPELCDEVDNDCDTDVDEGLDTTYYLDTDDDGYGDEDNTIIDCRPPSGYADNSDDCDDGEPSIHPGAKEVCADGIDQDCDTFDAECRIGGLMEVPQDADVVFTLSDASTAMELGQTVALLPDADGDGRAEVVMSSNEAVYVVDFHESFGWRGVVEVDLDHADYDRWTFSSADGGMGGAIARGGQDWDLDGAIELLVGTPGAGSDDAPLSGAVTVMRGSQWVNTPEAYDVSTGAIQLVSEVAGAELGASMDPGSDVNVVGVSDLVLGAPGQNTVYILFGCEEGLGGCASGSGGVEASAPWGGSAVAVSSVADEVVSGGDRFGERVLGGADHDGDGLDDVVITSPGQTISWAPNSGIVYIVTDFPLISTEITDSLAMTFRGDSFSYFGNSADVVGDVNGDGYADLMVGAHGLEGSRQGSAYLLLGRVNAEDVVASADAMASFKGWEYSETGMDVANLGDLDGDGRTELGIGCNGNGNAHANPSNVFIYSSDTSGVIDLAADEEDVATITSKYSGMRLGTRIAGMQDVSGEEDLDIVLGAPGYSDVGGAFLLLGGAKLE